MPARVLTKCDKLEHVFHVFLIKVPIHSFSHSVSSNKCIRAWKSFVLLFTCYHFVWASALKCIVQKLHISAKKVLQMCPCKTSPMPLKLFSRKRMERLHLGNQSKSKLKKINTLSPHTRASWRVKAWKTLLILLLLLQLTSIYMLQQWQKNCRKWEISRAPLKTSPLLRCKVSAQQHIKTKWIRVQKLLFLLAFSIMNGLVRRK